MSMAEWIMEDKWGLCYVLIEGKTEDKTQINRYYIVRWQCVINKVGYRNRASRVKRCYFNERGKEEFSN